MDKNHRNICNDMPVVILAGGLGSRLKEILPNTQKVVAEVAGRPFLDILLDELASNGFQKVILAVGHRSDQVRSLIRSRPKDHLDISFSHEKQKLGTGGAVKFASRMLKDQDMMVVNGDTYFLCDYAELIKFHKYKNSRLTILLREVRDSSRYGSVVVDSMGRIVKFAEKSKSEKGIVNAGAYIFDKSIIDMMPSRDSFSLELDFIPELIIKNVNVNGMNQSGLFFDIGTPETLENADKILKSRNAPN